MDQARISPLFSHDVDPVRFTRGISQPGIVEWKRAWGRTVRRRRQGQGPPPGREGKGREGKGDSRAEEGQFWLQEERKALCRRFSVARAL